jgi:uncharacterized repeat protein (TIGR01451 family)
MPIQIPMSKSLSITLVSLLMLTLFLGTGAGLYPALALPDAPESEQGNNDFRISFMGPVGDTSFAAAWPSIAFNPITNEYLVVWHADDNTDGMVDGEREIFGQRIQASDGSLVGSRIRISTMGVDGSAVYQASLPAVTYNSQDNEFFVVWQSDDDAEGMADNEEEIYGQRLSPMGSLLGGRIRISFMGPDGNANFDAFAPAIAYNSQDNEYLVNWYGDDNSDGLVDGEWEIFGQRLSAEGALLGNRLRLSTMGPAGSTLYTATEPVLAYNNQANEYLAAWTADDNQGGMVDEETEIFAQRVSSTGSLLGNRQRLSYMGPEGDPNYDARDADLIYNSLVNEFMVVWQADDNTSGMVNDEVEIFAQRLDPAINLVGGRVRLSFMGPDGNKNYSATTPRIGLSEIDNQYLVAWSGDTDQAGLVDEEREIFAQHVNQDGSLDGVNRRISDMGPDGNANYDGLNPDLAFSPQANEFLLVWQGSDNIPPLVLFEDEIFGQRYGLKDSDLEISLSAFPEPVEVGQTLTYTIQVTNHGPDPAKGVTIQDALPISSVVFQSVEGGSAWNCQENAGVISCDLVNPAVLPAEPDPLSTPPPITIVAMVNSCGSITNQATVSAMSKDPAQANNSDSTLSHTAGICADLGLAVTAQPVSVAIGDPLTYSLVVHNYGPDNSLDLTVTGTIPPEAALQNLDGSGAWSCSLGDEIFSCSLPQLANGEDSAPILINLKAEACGLIELTASVNLMGFDPVSANNQGSASLPTSDPCGQLGVDDFLVSTNLTGSDFLPLHPALAVNSLSGESLVVWSSDMPGNGLETEIFAQLLDSAGSLQGGLIQVSQMGPDGVDSYTASHPAVAYNASANEFMVVWSADDNTLPLVDDEFEIYAQRISADGSLVGSRLRISSMGPDGTTNFRGIEPDVAYNPSTDKYLVVWSGDDNTDGVVSGEMEIFGQQLSANGTLDGGRLRLSQAGPDGNPGYAAAEPDVVYHPGLNEYLLVFVADGDNLGLVQGEVEVFFQRVAANGTLVGTAQRLSSMGANGDPAYDAASPDIAISSKSGEALVAWSGDDNSGDLADDETEIYAQKISSSGSPQGAPTRVSQMGIEGEASFMAVHPAIAYNPSGGEYLIAWEASDHLGGLVAGELEIFSQRLSEDGIRIGDRLRLSSMGTDGTTDGIAQDPALLYNPLVDEYLVAWAGKEPGLTWPQGVFAQRYQLQSDLDLNLVNDPAGLIEPHSLLTYHMELINAGPATATYITLVEELSPGVIVMDVDSAGWSCNLDNRTLTCILAQLSPGTSAPDITIQAEANSCVPLTNQATVASRLFDPDNSQNTAEVINEVNCSYRVYIPTINK